MSPERYMREKARNLPIYKCYKGENPHNSREMLIMVVRQHKQGTFTYGSFLLDRWCIGVKDAMWNVYVDNVDLDELLNHYKRHLDIFEEIDYVEAHNWVYGAIAWAEDAGIHPHKDFNIAKYILEEDDDNVELIEYDFGLDGEHVLEAKSQQDANKYLPALRHTLGEGNFRVMISPLLDDDFDDYDDYDDYDEDDYDDEDEDEDEDDDEDISDEEFWEKMKSWLKKLKERFGKSPSMEYTYKGGNYPQTLALNHPQVMDFAKKDADDISEDEMRQVLSLPHDTLREDIHQLILWEIGQQWGKDMEDFEKDGDTSDWHIIGNALMLLIEAGNASQTLPVLLEVMRQNDDFIEYNFADIMDEITWPLLYKFCKDNPETLKPFLLEPGLTQHAKNIAIECLTNIAGNYPKAKERIINMTAEILKAYKEDLPSHTICDGGCTAFAIGVLVELGAKEHLPLIEELYATQLVDETIMGPIKDIRKYIRKPQRDFLPIHQTAYELLDFLKSF